MNLEESFYNLAVAAKDLASKLNTRETWAMQAGLHASHAEEALTIGDVPRAMAHFKSLLMYAELLSKYR